MSWAVAVVLESQHHPQSPKPHRPRAARTLRAPLEYRETFWADAFNGDWAARNKSNGNSEGLEDKHGGKVGYGGSFVHTFATLVPPATYFKEHPEYFSEVGGKRVDGYAQLCVTNEDVKKLITAKVLAFLRETPTRRSSPSPRTTATTTACVPSARSWRTKKARRRGRCSIWSTMWPPRSASSTRKWRLTPLPTSTPQTSAACQAAAERHHPAVQH